MLCIFFQQKVFGLLVLNHPTQTVLRSQTQRSSKNALCNKGLEFSFFSISQFNNIEFYRFGRQDIFRLQSSISLRWSRQTNALHIIFRKDILKLKYLLFRITTDIAT